MIYQIELTNVCNSACPWCPHRTMKRPQGYMSRETFEAILQDARKGGIVGDQLGLHHFGEPLLHPDLPYFLDRLSAEGIAWRLSTNGRLLSQPAIRRLLLSSAKGQLVISMENGAAVEDVQTLLREKQETGSDLAIVVQGLDVLGRQYRLEGDFVAYTQRCHTWTQDGDGFLSESCPFVIEDWICALWDGTYVSCCADVEGESVLGAAGRGRVRNHRWRACATCDVVPAFFEPPRGTVTQEMLRRLRQRGGIR
ncbi:MAG: radical SAM protein [Betaproteobacteria bacterium]